MEYKGMKMTIEYELRLCEVNGELGYFHCWEQWSKPIPPSVMAGGPPGGQLSQIFGVVEFGDGVRRVDPTAIKFCDEINATLTGMREAIEKAEELEGETNA